MKSYTITPQDNRYVTIKVMDFSNQQANHTLRLPINPALKNFTHPIRTTLTQTEGGAWIDDFGMGVPTLQLQGNTGWRPLYGRYNNSTIPDGFQAFQHLYTDIIRYFFNLRGQTKDPELIEMIVVDDVDQVTYRVTPTQNMQLQRTKSSPLLFPYTVNFIVNWSSLSTAAMKSVTDPVITTTPRGISQSASPTPTPVKQAVQNVQQKLTTVRQPPKRMYTVKPGDTLWGIAQEFYGNGSLDSYLAQINHIPNANLIFDGQQILVPTR